MTGKNGLPSEGSILSIEQCARMVTEEGLVGEIDRMRLARGWD